MIPKEPQTYFPEQMPADLSNFMDYHVPLTVNGVVLHFFIFTGEGPPQDADRSKLNALLPSFSRMPERHLRSVFPFIIIPGRLPSSGGGGGTPDHPMAAVRRHDRDLGTSPEVVLRIAEAYRGSNRMSNYHWRPSVVWNDAGRYPSTFLHEAIHGVDLNLRLHTRRAVTPAQAARLDIPRSVVRNYEPGDFVMTSLPGAVCRAGPIGIQAVVNAYFKLLGGFNSIPDTVRRRIARELSMARAFEDVPPSWWETTCPGLIPPPLPAGA